MSTDEAHRATPVSYEDRLAIATPEGVEVELTLANIGSRFIAGGIDFTIQLAVIISLALIRGRRATRAPPSSPRRCSR